MAKKRKKLDQFLSSRKKPQEVVLEEKTRLANRIFRYTVGLAAVVIVLVLAQPELFASAGRWEEALGLSVLVLLVAGIGVRCVRRLNPDLFATAASFNHFVLLVLSTAVLAKVMLFVSWSRYLVPLPFLAMIVGMAYSQVAALFLVAGMSLGTALMASDIGGTSPALPRFDFEMAAVMGLGGVVAVLGVARIRRQSRPVIVGLLVGLVQAVAILCCKLLAGQFAAIEMARAVRAVLMSEPGQEAGVEALKELLRDPGYGFAGGVIYGGIVTSILPVIERFFGVVTERRLLDLADPSNNLLRVLRERAPGTFQHTLGVQQLARGAAEAIGADPLLMDVGAYYHDIGKIYKPEYFVENMGEDKSIHDRLRPSMSKLIIISHVKDGMLLAKEEKLPQKIVDMIPMHHGTTVVEYFFRKARKVTAEEALPVTEEVEYRYPGPKPRFPEAGILMLADAVEAIAKTLEEPTPNRFRDTVRELIHRRLLDGQLDECNLTMADLRRIEDSFVRTLTNMYHGRIKYPSAEGQEVTPAGPAPEAAPALGAARAGARVS